MGLLFAIEGENWREARNLCGELSLDLAVKLPSEDEAELWQGLGKALIKVQAISDLYIKIESEVAERSKAEKTTKPPTSPPANALFIIAWFATSPEQSEELTGDLIEVYAKHAELMGGKRAAILAYKRALSVAAPTFGRWVRHRILKQYLGGAAAWLDRKLNPPQ